jgi:quaternary ammonium compound-resistance protein SugE
LKLSEGLTRPLWSVAFLLLSLVSFALLTLAAQTIPLGTAYAIWTGIGALGTALIGIAWFGDPITCWRLFFLSGLIVCLVGLKWVSPD